MHVGDGNVSRARHSWIRRADDGVPRVRQPWIRRGDDDALLARQPSIRRGDGGAGRYSVGSGGATTHLGRDTSFMDPSA